MFISNFTAWKDLPGCFFFPLSNSLYLLYSFISKKLTYFSLYYIAEIKKSIIFVPSKKRRTLFNGVMAAQQILVLLVKVRILVEQQKILKNSSGFFSYSQPYICKSFYIQNIRNEL